MTRQHWVPPQPDPGQQPDRRPRPVAHGHLPHQTGSGPHDNRPRRLRDRQARERDAINRSANDD